MHFHLGGSHLLSKYTNCLNTCISDLLIELLKYLCFLLLLFFNISPPTSKTKRNLLITDQHTKTLIT